MRSSNSGSSRRPAGDGPELFYRKERNNNQHEAASQHPDTGHARNRNERDASQARLNPEPNHPEAANRRGRRLSLSDDVLVPDDAKDHGECDLNHRCST